MRNREFVEAFVLPKLKQIHKEIHDSSWHKVARLLTKEERDYIFGAAKALRLPCTLFTYGNQGVGMQIWQNHPTMGISPFPGAKVYSSDLTCILSFKDEHLFDNSAPDRKYGSAQQFLEKCFRILHPFVARDENMEMLKRYKFSIKHFVLTLRDCEY